MEAKTMSKPKMTDVKVVTKLKNFQHEMLHLNRNLHAFRNDVRSVNPAMRNDVIVHAAIMNIGTTADFTVPKMYQNGQVFGRLQGLAISRHLFSAEDINAIENKLGRRLDKFDTIYVRRPVEGGLQGLVLLRLVRLRDIAHKL